MYSIRYMIALIKVIFISCKYRFIEHINLLFGKALLPMITSIFT